MMRPWGRRLQAVLDAASGWRYHGPMTVQFTAVFRPVPGGYVAYVEELPGANTQGATLDEARANLEEAVSLVLEANRILAREDAVGVDVIREPLQLTA
jgi:predicted RNase H-like HicB family nuclease